MLLMIAQVVAAASVPQMPAWMAGCWEQRSGSKWIEECWTGARGGLMIGSSRTGQGGKVAEWETMQIVVAPEPRDASVPPMAFWASPGGTGRTVFEWVPSDKAGVTFANPKHDYPQRIRYWREGNELLAEISRTDGTGARRWRMQRKGD